MKCVLPNLLRSGRPFQQSAKWSPPAPGSGPPAQRLCSSFPPSCLDPKSGWADDSPRARSHPPQGSRGGFYVFIIFGGRGLRFYRVIHDKKTLRVNDRDFYDPQSLNFKIAVWPFPETSVDPSLKRPSLYRGSSVFFTVVLYFQCKTYFTTGFYWFGEKCFRGSSPEPFPASWVSGHS